MTVENYRVSQYSVKAILGFIDAEDFAIPEIQRPFVWKKVQVRDLIDSLYNGYPIGYLIIWQNPDVRLKSGGTAKGKKVLIDGQQRVTALMAAISGLEIVDKDFKKERIKIAFNPFAANGEKYFETLTPVIAKNKKWIPDISEIFNTNFNNYTFTSNYCKENPDMSEADLSDKLMKLQGIISAQIGVVELDTSLDIGVITDIFARINSQGSSLNQSDFVMSKIASNSKYGGNMLRKAIDVFSRLAKKPEDYDLFRHDEDFNSTDYFKKLQWLKDNGNKLYVPDYSDILRVTSMQKFSRVMFKDLVSLLSGRDFETREFHEDIAEETFLKLKEGVLEFMQEENFKEYTLALYNAGFISNWLITSSLSLDFGYALLFLLRRDSRVKKQDISHYLQKWFVMSLLTSRYTGSSETKIDSDLREIKNKGFPRVLEELEASELSDTFWRTLPQRLNTTSQSSLFKVFLAALIRSGSSSLLQTNIPNRNLLDVKGDVHHIFPKEYLKKNGITNRSQINQIANLTYLDTQINRAMHNSAPREYFRIVSEQCSTKKPKYGNITDFEIFKRNLQENCIPESIIEMDYTRYDEFLQERREMIAIFIKNYYKNL